jgi:cbb3-type cytochrome oxidase subunit 3
MDDDGASLPDSPEPDAEPDPEITPLPSLPAEVTTGDDELRRLIDAGASSPEELRELAARIREHRDREEAVWRSEVRPALKKAKKRRFNLGDLVERSDEPKTPNAWLYGFGLAGLIVVLVLAAAQSSILWVLLPLIGVLAYAYRQGKRGDAADEPPFADGDTPD